LDFDVHHVHLVCIQAGHSQRVAVAAMTNARHQSTLSCMRFGTQNRRPRRSAAERILDSGNASTAADLSGQLTREPAICTADAATSGGT